MICFQSKENGEKARQLQENDPLVMAHHEAGHAVVAIHKKIKFSYLTLIPSGNCYGKTVFSKNNCNYVNALKKRNIERIRRQIVMLYAGDRAEQIYYNRTLNISQLTPSEDKVVKLYNFDDSKVDCPGNTDDVEIRKLREIIGLPGLEYTNDDPDFDEAFNIVIEHWNEIEAVAHSLVKEKQLGYFRVREIIKNS